MGKGSVRRPENNGKFCSNYESIFNPQPDIATSGLSIFDNPPAPPMSDLTVKASVDILPLIRKISHGLGSN